MTQGGSIFTAWLALINKPIIFMAFHLISVNIFHDIKAIPN